MDSGLITFLITLGVLAVVFAIMYKMGKDYKHTKKKVNR
jgi:hypothetical protein